MWKVRFHPVATKELARLPPRERAAVLKAVDKLTLLGPALPFAHCSAVQGVAAAIARLGEVQEGRS
jgi:mRNA-degrading endonuclease RelE of RelBE toxin-antitoxin system